MSASSTISVRFWGVRGSVACPGAETIKYGGNTPCVEVLCGENLIIFDGGTGLRALGEHLLKKRIKCDADIFYSHCHLDHVCGLPFFAPGYVPGGRLRLWAGNLLPATTLRQVVQQIMGPPLFPLHLDVLKADIEFNDFRAGDVLRPRQGVILRTATLNHPGGATGYRLEYGGKSVVYITDTEHSSEGLDQNILSLSANADLMIYDCTYSDEEYSRHVGWGHSTWQQGVKLANAASVKVFVLFHHDPDHDDAFMDGIAKAAKTARAGSVVAREGVTLQI